MRQQQAGKRQLRAIAAPSVALGPSGVAIRDRLKRLTPQDEEVLRLVGAHQGALASRDLKQRCADGHGHCADTWAARKRELTAVSSSRIAGTITKATHDQWALARRSQAAHIENLQAGIRTLRQRLSLPLGEKGGQRAPGGYRSRNEWFHKSRRLATLQARHGAAVHDLGAWSAWTPTPITLPPTAWTGTATQWANRTASPTTTSPPRRPARSTVAEGGWGSQHWQKPLSTPQRKVSRHDAASIAIGRRALGHPIRRRAAPPPHDQSDHVGHRTVQAGPGSQGRGGNRPSATDRPPGEPPPSGKRTWRPSASKTVRDARSDQLWVQDSRLLTDEERFPGRTARARRQAVPGARCPGGPPLQLCEECSASASQRWSGRRTLGP